MNVAIRTLVLKKDGSGTAGSGSGVVFESGATPEYDECRLKLRFIENEPDTFDLFETMAFHPETGIFLFDRHLDRMSTSADYFGIPFDRAAVQQMLEVRTKTYASAMRVRVTLKACGTAEICETDLVTPDEGDVWNVAVAAETTSPENRFLYHKTSRRCLYDEVRRRYGEQTGCQEVLFLNNEGYVTEGSFTNVFVRRQGHLLTPALRHGLLPGTFRAGLLEHGLAREGDLRLEDLAQAAQVYVGNSVRGLIPVHLTR